MRITDSQAKLGVYVGLVLAIGGLIVLITRLELIGGFVSVPGFILLYVSWRLGHPFAARKSSAMAAGASREATGANGSLTVFDDRVRLTKGGWRATLGVGYGAGSKDIAISQITAIQWRDAGAVLVGYIAFSFVGGADRSGGGVSDVVKSENAVTFFRSQQPAFDAIRADIQTRIGAGGARTDGSSSSSQQLRELARLRDDQVITADEFETKKAELLRRM